MMKFPPVEVNTTNTTSLGFLFDRIFGEENAIESIDTLENGNVCIHFNQDLPMTANIQKFYDGLRVVGEVTMKPYSK